jgi:hypothetical protein
LGKRTNFDTGDDRHNIIRMSKVEAIEAEIRCLPREKAEQLRDWLSEYLEDNAELNPEFVKSMERGKADIQAGRVRLEKP